jgi:hypothetical protein
MSMTSLTIITAQNPHGIRHSSARNYDLNRKLWLELKAEKRDIMHIQGEYAGNHENSFLVFDLPRSQVMDLQKRYKQKAVIWGFVRNIGFDHPTIHWQYIENGRAIGHKLTPVPKEIASSREDFMEGIKKGLWKLPIFEIDKEKPMITDSPDESPFGG